MVEGSRASDFLIPRKSKVCCTVHMQGGVTVACSCIGTLQMLVNRAPVRCHVCNTICSSIWPVRVRRAAMEVCV